MNDKLFDLGHTFLKILGKVMTNLSKQTLLALTFIFILIAYWFISIYLICPYFYNNNPIWVVIILCFVLAVNWFISNISLIVLQNGIYVLKNELNKIVSNEFNTKDIFLSSGLSSLLILSFFSFIWYWNHWHFLNLILSVFVYVFSIFFLSLCKLFYLTEKIEKNKLLEEIDRKIEQE